MKALRRSAKSTMRLVFCRQKENGMHRNPCKRCEGWHQERALTLKTPLPHQDGNGVKTYSNFARIGNRYKLICSSPSSLGLGNDPAAGMLFARKR